MCESRLLGTIDLCGCQGGSCVWAVRCRGSEAAPRFAPLLALPVIIIVHHSSPFNMLSPFHPCSHGISVSSLPPAGYTHKHTRMCTKKKHQQRNKNNHKTLVHRWAKKKGNRAVVPLLICLVIHNINKTWRWICRLTRRCWTRGESTNWVWRRSCCTVIAWGFIQTTWVGIARDHGRQRGSSRISWNCDFGPWQQNLQEKDKAVDCYEEVIIPQKQDKAFSGSINICD